MSKHTDFILSPITDILKDATAANAPIGNGIETYPLTEYIMQSVFLKMTGFQEQKMKCIVWELATNDYEYRYKRFTLRTLGECSTYDEKKIVYKDLLEILKKYNPDFKLDSEERAELRRDTFSSMRTLFLNSNLPSWAEVNFLEISTGTLFTNDQFATDVDLLQNNLQDKYALLYKHRNRCAHNTLSYQENLPTLATLLSKSYAHDNYFVRFTLLILIDNIFRKLYVAYLNFIEEDR